MSEPRNGSMETTQIETTENPGSLETELKAKGVEPSHLAVLVVGSEQMFCEVPPVPPKVMEAMAGVTHIFPSLAGTLVRAKNPRRLLRLQQVQQGNFRIDFLLVDWDFIDKGEVDVVPDAGYYLRDLDPASQTRMYQLYLSFLGDKLRQRAAEAGITLARPGGMPGAPVRSLR